ncbi:Holliday junction resolvase, partial [Candidatus Woesearchaeota archaeon]|nr:Holliday junction resolvase [Candidatus Woesearchaeota archaeon]
MVKNKKQKGSTAERELIHLFWKQGWAAVRVAGSGSMKYPSPDIVASNALRRLAVECKAVGDDKKYLTQDEIEQLILFSQRFGAEAWLAVRFDNEDWYFFNV